MGGSNDERKETLSWRGSEVGGRGRGGKEGGGVWGPRRGLRGFREGQGESGRGQLIDSGECWWLEERGMRRGGKGEGGRGGNPSLWWGGWCWHRVGGGGGGGGVGGGGGGGRGEVRGATYN